MSVRVLLIDDDSSLLAALPRMLRKGYHLHMAANPAEALALIQRGDPFAVIVTDMHMKGMNGVELLAKSAKLSPDSVRILLTASCDFATAINAVNEGRVFRFLAKPCSPELLVKSIKAAAEQYRLVTVERELLQKTLIGSVRVLTEVLSLVSPVAFSRATRIRHLVRHMAATLKLANVWQFELAAMLSQVGCVTLPPEVLEKVCAGTALSGQEQKMYAAHPLLGKNLLINIPRLEGIAEMIAGQNRPFRSYSAHSATDRVMLGAQMLKLALDLDRHFRAGLRHQEAIDRLSSHSHLYNPEIFNTLSSLRPEGLDDQARREVELTVGELREGMVACEDVWSMNNLLLVPRWEEITETLLIRLQNFRKGVGVREPIRVSVADKSVMADSKKADVTSVK